MPVSYTHLDVYKRQVLASPKYFYGLIVGQNIWKETGYGTIVFLSLIHI